MGEWRSAATAPSTRRRTAGRNDPRSEVLSINLWINSEKITTGAIVRSCDGGVGMGIEFTGLDPKVQERLQQQVETMAAECGLSQKI